MFDKIFFGAVGPHTELDSVHSLFDHRAECIAHHEDTNIYERLTLHAMYEHAQKDSFFCLYLHSKGITKPHHRHQVEAWRNMMLHFTCHYWPLCLAFLEKDDYIGAVGCNLFHHPARHFSGNFWWTSSHVLQTLSIPIGNAYLDPEMWLGKTHYEFVTLYQHPHWLCLHTPFDRYPYVNKFHEDSLRYLTESCPPLSIEKDIPDIMYWGYGFNWVIITKDEWLNTHNLKDKKTPTVKWTVNGDRLCQDPCVGFIKMLTFQHHTTRQLYCFVEHQTMTLTP